MIGKRILNVWLIVLLLQLLTPWQSLPTVKAAPSRRAAGAYLKSTIAAKNKASVQQFLKSQTDSPSKPAAQSQAALENLAPPPLPMSCIGGGTPINYDNPICCVSGYVYWNGTLVTGAEVTVEANGQTITTQTQIFPGSALPYYFISFYDEPLNVRPGQTVSVTVNFGGQNRSETFVAQTGGQQVDVVLLQTQTTWKSDQQIKAGDPAPRHSAALNYWAETLWMMGGSTLDPATYRWDGIAWALLAPAATLRREAAPQTPGSSPVSGPNTTGAMAQLATDPTWTTECIDCPRYFQNMTDRSLRLDANGHPHVAYGDDHLYYAWYDGAAWHTEVVDNAPGVGSYASLALDGNGYPHISYFDAVNADLKYAWQDGSMWHIQALDIAAQACGYTSLALDNNGYARISYCSNAPKGDLKYAWQDSTRWHFEVLDETGNTGFYTSIALDSYGYAHISYHGGNGSLKYAWQDATGWHIQGVDTSGSTTSLILDSSGYAHISYYSKYDLKYAWQDATGWHTEVVDSGSDGKYTSLALDSREYAHISYYAGNAVLKYAWQDAAGWHTTTADLAGSVGKYTSIALDNAGYPHVTYYNSTNYQLKHAWQDLVGWHIEVIDTARDVNRPSSLVLDRSGYPHYTYYDLINHDLRYTWLDATGWHFQTVASGRDIGLYNSLALDSSDYAYISYYDNTYQDLRFAWQDAVGWHFTNLDNAGDVGLYPSLVLDRAGYAHISYYEGKINLKYAWEDASGWHTQIIPGAVQSGSNYGTSLALDNDGYAHIAYFADGKLKYVRQNTSNWQIEILNSVVGWTGNISLAVDSKGYAHIGCGSLRYTWKDAAGWHFKDIANGGKYSSLVLDSGDYPHISYYDVATLDLKYTWQDAAGWYTQTIDGIGDVGQYNFLALDQNGNAHIIYYDVTNHDIKYAYSRTVSSPSIERYAHILARNTDNADLLTFGGIGIGGKYLNDTWRLTASQWELLLPSLSPSARAYSGLVYDPHQHHWVLFGGKNQAGDLGDTWLFDGTNWTQAQPLHSPPSRSEATLTYDPKRQRAVLVGGRGGGALLADVWEWDGSDWIDVTPAQPLSARAGHGAAYDSARQVVVVAAGMGSAGLLSDVWEWNGTAWVQRVIAPPLPAMAHLATEYDPVNDQIVILGGESGSGLVQGTLLLKTDVTPTHAPPVAAIFRISPRDARQDENLSFQGRGVDADASGSGSPIKAFRWLLGAEVLSTQPEFTLPASRFSCGEHEIGFQVQDNEDLWSPVVHQTIFVRDSNGGNCKGKSWTLLVYAAGDNNLGVDLQWMVERIQRSGALPNVQVGILYDGPKSNDTRRYTLTANGEWAVQTLPEARMDDMETLRDFIRWGFEHFKTDYYFVALADHANGAIGFAQDLSSSDPVTNPKPFLTPIEMRSALQAATNDGTRKIDVLMFDGCSFGLFENAAIAAGQAQLVIASPNTGWGEFAYERYRQLASGSDNPRVFAQKVASAYAEEVRASNPKLPYTISVFDLARFEVTKAAIDNLGNRILNYIMIDPIAHSSEIEAIRSLSQKYDSGGAIPYETDNDDSYIDLVSLAENLDLKMSDAGIKNAALAVKEAVKGAQPFIVYEEHASGDFQYYDPTTGKQRRFTVKLDNAHGLGIFYPPHATALPNSAYQRYIANQLFDITTNWNWTAFLKSDLPALSDRLASAPPLMDDALISLPLPPKKIFVPLTQR